MIVADMHSHTDFSGDCQIPYSEMIEQAIKSSLKYYAITDHHDIDFSVLDPDFTIDPTTYFPALVNIEKKYNDRIRIIKGIEYGLQPHLVDTLSELVQSYDYDYILGSNHLAYGEDPYDKTFFEGLTKTEGYQKFFEATLENIQLTKDIDALAHLDYAIRYWRGEGIRQYTYSEHAEVLDAILKTLIRQDIALEVNTAGYIQKLEQPNPSYDVLSRYHELGGELLTIGSDAHLPQNIKSHFDIVEERLKQIGFKSYTVYLERKPTQISF